MKFLHLSIFVLLITSLNVAKSTAQIEFADSNFEEQLDIALKENKLLFVDFTAKWCRPCQQLEKTTFPDSTLSSYINEQFISLKLDIDKAEGKKVKGGYSVFSYPTLLVINPKDRKVVLRIMGYKPAQILLGDLQAMRRPEGY